jgi:outer membrane protein OmpA-like peptidoglycan-associated protein
MDDQRAELERKLADERQREQLGITEVGGNTLKIGIAGDATFEFDKSVIQPQFKPTYGKIASTLADFDQTIIHVVGHTDSIGAEAYNERLSRDRAEAVGEYLRDQGVNGNRIIYYGMGEMQPVASNETDDGRRRNRRVDIFLKPVVEGEERQAYTPPPGVHG